MNFLKKYVHKYPKLLRFIAWGGIIISMIGVVYWLLDSTPQPVRKSQKPTPNIITPSRLVDLKDIWISCIEDKVDTVNKKYKEVRQQLDISAKQTSHIQDLLEKIASKTLKIKKIKLENAQNSNLNQSYHFSGLNEKSIS